MSEKTPEEVLPLHLSFSNFLKNVLLLYIRLRAKTPSHGTVLTKNYAHAFTVVKKLAKYYQILNILACQLSHSVKNEIPLHADAQIPSNAYHHCISAIKYRGDIRVQSDGPLMEVPPGWKDYKHSVSLEKSTLCHQKEHERHTRIQCKPLSQDPSNLGLALINSTILCMSTKN